MLRRDTAGCNMIVPDVGSTRFQQKNSSNSSSICLNSLVKNAFCTK